MTAPPRWHRCISHRAHHVQPFFEEYLSRPDRKVLLIGGAGFDPRSTVVAELIARFARERTRGCFLREERPRPGKELVQRAGQHEGQLAGLFASCDVVPLEIFAADDAVVGGRTVVGHMQRMELQAYTDIFVDLSALSIGVAFPIVRYLYEALQGAQRNLHLVVVDEPGTDAAIRATACDYATTIHGFKGGWELDGRSNAAKLWMPQLSHNNKTVLELIHTRVQPHAVCPILPFPASVARLADRLIEDYGEQIQNPWQVDARDIVYADERSPVDLYRTILKIDDARQRVFAETGGSQMILSPVGSKALAMGALMAALERDFTVMYVESLGYSVDFGFLDEARRQAAAQVVHIWLHGEVYGMSNKKEST